MSLCELSIPHVWSKTVFVTRTDNRVTEYRYRNCFPGTPTAGGAEGARNGRGRGASHSAHDLGLDIPVTLAQPPVCFPPTVSTIRSHSDLEIQSVDWMLLEPDFSGFRCQNI